MMLLLTYMQWLGPGRRMTFQEATNTKPTEEIVSFTTRLSLSDAVIEIKNYQDRYNARYPLAINFKLISVSNVEMSDDALEICGAELVEDLSTQP